MELKIIAVDEDTTQPMYASVERQQLINVMTEYYTEIGFNSPWVGYFVIRDNQVVGTGGFTGSPKEGSVEVAYWTFKEFERQGVALFTCKTLVSIAKNTYQSSPNSYG
jgi:[ribosomal protein S5]-alanine N-acetyltransferase